MRNFALLLAAILLISPAARADMAPRDYSFEISAQTIPSPATITLHWPAKQVPQITVRRKLLTDPNWGPAVTLPGSATSYTDTSIQPARAYEYELQGVIQENPRQIAYGYICAGTLLPPDENRGKVMLVVDNRFSAPLASDLETLRLDLIGDGWKVVRRDVSPSSSPGEVKALIRAEWNADPANMRSVFLIGHVPVPYSGKIRPDMHADHTGAWPADVYYGEMDGEWTDNSVYQTGSTYPWNNNVPGDGKFDNSTIPGFVELEVGRVDFHDMPAFSPRSETDLLRNYLRKNHAFRHRTLNASSRGLIRDNFRTIDGDAPAVDAWRAFPALFGDGNVAEIGANQFFPVLQNDSYLFAYAGGGGDWEKADGVGTTDNFVNGDPKAIFYLLHGSYFGDWNTLDNFLRSAIATPNYGLVSIWSSLPHWYFHPMALGETIGFATKLTQNNRNANYRNAVDFSIGEVHISMMGDPTLHAFPLAPASNFQVNVADKLYFSWNESWQQVSGYNLYYANSYDGPFTKATRATINGSSFQMSLLPAGRYVFMLRALTLQTTGSGTFNNLSQGMFVEADIGGNPPPPPEITIAATDATGNEDGDSIIFTLSRSGAVSAGLNVIVQFSGTAVLGQDFLTDTTVAFKPGNATATVLVAPWKDSSAEPAENVTVTIVGGSGYTIGAANSATGTIASDLPPPLPEITIAATDATGNEDGDSIIFTLSRTETVTAALNVIVQFSGTAVLGHDFLTSTNLAFQPGNATATVRVAPWSDSVFDEPAESVTVTIVAGSGYAIGAANSATATIAGDPPPPMPTITIAATDTTGDEKGDGLVFTATRTTPLDAALNVAVQLSGTATAGQDFQAVTTLAFQPGSATATVSITPTDDGLNEGEETVVVTLVAGAGYQLGTTLSATGTIAASLENKIEEPTISPVGRFGFTAHGFPNRAYRVQSRIPDGIWVTRTNGVSRADGSFDYRDGNRASAECLYYRVVWE